MSEDTTAESFPSNNSTVVVPDAGKHFQELALVVLLSIVIVITVIGNTLVILAVLTTRRLRTVTNCFVISLAIADWLVGVFVMPPAIANLTMGTWELGWILCDIWVSLDILLCTASILSLCAISVDRYLAVTQPLSYSRKRRSKRLASLMILGVWFSSALITCPPMFGWYEPGRHKDKMCRYNRNTGYVIFSAMGSFFIPMVVMVYVYARISCVVAQRHDQLGHIDNRNRKSQKFVLSTREDSEIDRRSSECEEQNLRCTREITGQPTLLIASYDKQGVLRSYSNSSPQGMSSDPLNHNSHNEQRKNGSQTRSVRSNYSYTTEPVTPQRSASLYAATTFSAHRARPESLHLDMSVLNFEGATRVSSFRRETKTAQTLSIVVGGFIACWLPFFVYYILTPFLPSSMVNNNVIMAYFTWLGWINSAINPFIYAFYSPDFRIAFWRLTCKHFSKSHRADMSFQHK